MSFEKKRNSALCRPVDGMSTAAMAYPRRATKRIMVGSVPIGGGAPVVVQSMTKTLTHQVGRTVAQVKRLEGAGRAIVRLARPAGRKGGLSLSCRDHRGRKPVLRDREIGRRTGPPLERGAGRHGPRVPDRTARGGGPGSLSHSRESWPSLQRYQHRFLSDLRPGRSGHDEDRPRGREAAGRPSRPFEGGADGLHGQRAGGSPGGGYRGRR